MRPLALLLASTSALIPTALAQTPAFKDASAAWGVDVVHGGSSNIDHMSGGVAFLDYDRDGDDDLFTPSSDGMHRLFRNDGSSFVDVSGASAVQAVSGGTNMGVIVGDYNNDGYPDIYLTNRGANNLLTNLKNGTFRDDAATLGVAGSDWSSSASWADFDRDGDLDLYVGNYVDKGQFPYNLGAPNNFYVNIGTAQQPNFQDLANQYNVEDSGVLPAADPMWPHPPNHPDIYVGAPCYGNALSVSTIDFDDDGDQDLLIGNDFGPFVLPDRLYRNDGAGPGSLMFTDASAATGFNAHGHFNMGINGADYDHDGDWDFYMSNMGPNFMFRNDNGFFSEVGAAAGVVSGEIPDVGNPGQMIMLTSWASVWCDFDNDLWEDLYVCNGYIPSIMPNAAREPNYLYRNLGNGTFKTLSANESGAMDMGVGRGVAYADVNSDGLMDFYASNLLSTTVGVPTDHNRLFINQGTMGPTGMNWLQMRLHGRESNADALGARIELQVGGNTLKRQILADPVFCSSSSRMAHFGLGPFSKTDKIEVRWPSGIYQELHGLPGQYRYSIHEPSVLMQQQIDPKLARRKLTLSAEVTNASAAQVDSQVFWLLHLGDGGPRIAWFSTAVQVPAGQTITVELPLQLPGALHMDLVGKVFDQRTFVLGAQGLDSRRGLSTLYLTHRP